MLNYILVGRSNSIGPVDSTHLPTSYLGEYYEQGDTRISQASKGRLLPSTKNLTKRAQRDSLASQGDSSSAGSSRRSSRSRSLVPVVPTNCEEDEEAAFAQRGMEPPPQPQLSDLTSSEKGKASRGSQQPKRKYSYPVKRYWLNRDPKDKSIGSNGVGMKVVGGRECPDLGGKLVAYVAQIFPGGLAEHLGDIQEGDVIVEWDSKGLNNKTFEEVTSILQESRDKQEFEMVIRRDLNVKTGKVYFLGSTDDIRRQSDCGTEAGSGITDSQSAGQTQPDSTDENASEPSRPADLAYTSSGTGASEGNTPKTNTQEDEVTPLDSIARHQPGFQNRATSLTTNSLRTPGFDESGDGKIIRRHSDLPPRPEQQKSESKLKWLQQRRSFGYDIQRQGSFPSSTSQQSEQTDTFKPHAYSKQHETEQKKVDASINGQISLQICHDPKASILYVTVLKARLPKQLNEDGTDHVPVDPYIVCSLYPERTIENQRRTRHVPMCSEPEFNQTMVYPQISLKDVREKTLEVCAWNYSPMGEDELFGKVILSLSEQGILDEQPHSYPLKLEELSGRKVSGPKGVLTRQSSITHHTTGRATAENVDNTYLQRSKGTTSRRCPLASTFSLTGGIHKKLTGVGPGSVPATSTSPDFPIDCHGTLCCIL